MIDKKELNILVLDDEPFILKLTAQMLANLGYKRIVSCKSGREALDWMKDHTPALILLDLNMPEMDGMEFIRHLVENKFNSDVILVSGEDIRMQQTVEKLIASHGLNCLGYLIKPVHPGQLSKLLDSWNPDIKQPSLIQKKVYSAKELKHAINNNELINFYQPKIDLKTGKPMGVEVLVRWNHPQDGLVFPDQFINIAETNDLINPLTLAVANQAFEQCNKWAEDGIHLKVAVNISMESLTSLDFYEAIISAVSSSRIVPEDIILEVTESQLMKNSAVSLEILSRLCIKRFNLSIDDFGTGHSSLTQLRDIPFNELKIDRSFVHGAHSNETLKAIFNASLEMARQLKMKVVSEGAENQADWDFLKASGCDYVQGYFVAKPMPASEIPNWITQWESKLEHL